MCLDSCTSSWSMLVAAAAASLLRDCPVRSTRYTKTKRGGLSVLVGVPLQSLSVVPALTLPRGGERRQEK